MISTRATLADKRAHGACFAHRYRGCAATVLLVALVGCSGKGTPSPAVPKTDALSSARHCTPPGSEPIWIAGGDFQMGSDQAYPEEKPQRQVQVQGFWLDRHEVTNAQFAQFVDATGYVTVAERPVDAAAYPGAPADMLLPGSAVFIPPKDNNAADMDWWRYLPGAYWRKPYGPDGPDVVDNEPVVHVSFEDAQRYAQWRGARLPTEVEWEFAARANQPLSMEQPRDANTWQGAFPYFNTVEDGYTGIAPVGCFAPNAFGLYDVIGNVWEWTADRYASSAHIVAGSNPGPDNPNEPVAIIKGGSYLCSPNYCRRYRVTARSGQDTGLGTNHIGLRLAYDRPAPPRDTQ